METAFEFGSSDELEIWNCPSCTYQMVRVVRYGDRDHWERAVHHHLSHHFTTEDLERLAPPMKPE